MVSGPINSVQLLSCVWLFATPWTAACQASLSITNSQSLLKLMSLAWIFIGRTDAEAPILWPPDVKSQLIGKDPDAGKDWRQKEKRAVEDEMVGWHHWLNGHESEQTPGDSEGQGSLACCSSWGCKESEMTGWLNNKFKKKQLWQDQILVGTQRN